MTPYENCPPVSNTLIQTIAFDHGWTGGYVSFTFGGVTFTITQTSASGVLAAFQAALAASFPGSICFTTYTLDNASFTVKIYFATDPGVPGIVSENALTYMGSNVVTIGITPEGGGTYPNYNYLTTRWVEFVLSDAAAIPAFEVQLFQLKRLVWNYVRPKNWGKAFNDATFLLIAHMVKLSKEHTGYVTGMTAKNLSVNFADDKYLDGTVYGQEFRRLRNHIIKPIGFAGAGGTSVMPVQGVWQGGFEGPHNGDYTPIN